MLKKYQKMKNNKLIYIAILLCILSFLILYINNNYNNILNYIIDKYTNKADTVLVSDTIRYVDTLTIFKQNPTPKTIILTKIDTFYTKEGSDTILKTENKVYQDTLCQKDDSAIVTSYITGINANLDSTKVQLRITKETITNTIEITKYIERKKTFWNRFHIGLQAGYGYGFKSKEFTPYIGVGGSFDF